MTYTGSVQPGGRSDVRELDALTIRKASVSRMDNNVYLLTCRETGEQLLIDAADDASRIQKLITEGTGAVDTIVTTHQHWDHHRALPEIAGATGATTAAGAPDADALPVIPNLRLAHGDRVTFGAIELDVIQLRGHTPGSVALAYADPAGGAHLFTGDSLFPGGPGKTWAAADFASLMSDLEARVFDVYDDDTWVYPGHGKDTMLGTERPHLHEWRERGW
ncbi:MBL fold metallo-hydrolase [Segeticoccus rhizosphaerae]|jgi:glyoxylase-like metal-dependent hydrolase (beta-lactamase superfamily II)|uniref:MBL fold metallo-hydrolase n=1 Tax=Segeticoccus rhizosphaerae TaxID=1104777 RepID=UPI0010C0EC25|nr:MULTISPECIES: MBL fold metallo-hydrolase [Intrasporangiaceae]